MSAKPFALTADLQSTQLSKIVFSSPWCTTACILASDFVSLALVFAIAVLGRHLLTSAYEIRSYIELLPFLAMILCGFWLQGLYPGVLLHPAEEMRRIFFAVTFAFLAMACSVFLWRNFDAYSRSVFLATWAGGSPLVLLARHATRRLFKARPWWGIPAILLGSGVAAKRVAQTLQDGRWGIRIVGVLTDDPRSAWPDNPAPIVGSLKTASPIAFSRAAEYAIVAMPQIGADDVRRTMQTCCQGFRRILLVPDMPGLCSLGIVARQMGAEIGFEVPQRLFQRGPAAAKRLLDIILSSSCLALLLPVLFVLAILVRLSSRGPILYGQNRYGKNGQTFKVLKFRTMVPNADAVLAHYLAAHPELLFEWQRNHKLKRDPRVTFAGKWMRRLSLDELPQLFNVLAGQMSLVGPRPIVQAEIERYGNRYGLYSRVRPGITGLWQVSGRNNTSYEERVTLDEYYVNNWSIWLDAYIFVRTIRTLATAEGAY